MAVAIWGWNQSVFKHFPWRDGVIDGSIFASTTLQNRTIQIKNKSNFRQYRKLASNDQPDVGSRRLRIGSFAMRIWKIVAAGATLLSTTILVSAASADVLDVTSVGVNSWNTLLVDGRNEVATAIELTTTELPKPLWVFCVDLAHNIYVQGYNPPLQYQTGPVNTDSSGATSGAGNPISLQQSAQIQTLVNIGSGLANAAAPDAEKLTAIAGAIWEVEYGYSASQVVGTPTENALIAQDIAYAQAHPATDYARGIYPVGPNGQGFGVTQGFSIASPGGQHAGSGGPDAQISANEVPEPATWSMMIVGVGLLGAALRQRRARTRGPATA